MLLLPKRSTTTTTTTKLLVTIVTSILILQVKSEEASSSSHHHHDHHEDHDHHHHHHHPQVKVANDNEHHKQLYSQHSAAHQQPSTTSRVLELSDRFLEIVNTVMPPSTVKVSSSNNNDNIIGPNNASPKYQPWLVMFYAPWCGHCKRLEPIFNHVAQALHNTPIRVGRVDCTRFPSVGQEFKIHGYPTIMFINGPTRRSTFQGDREVHQIVKFAKRMNSPPVTVSPLHLNTFLATHARDPPPHEHNPARVKREDHPANAPPDHTHFFGLLRPKGYRDTLTDAFESIAAKYQQWNEFFEFQHESVVVFVYKNGRMLVFNEEQQQDVVTTTDDDGNNVTMVLEKWVGLERYSDFMQLTRGNLYHVFTEGKQFIVVGVVNEDKLERVVNETERDLLQTLKHLATSTIQQTIDTSPQLTTLPTPLTVKSSLYPAPHQYAWIGSPDLANSLLATTLPLPTLLIIQKSTHTSVDPDPSNHKYYVFSDPSQFSTESKIQNIIELVLDNHFTPTVHANSWSFKVYRYLFDVRTNLADMWNGNPVLTIVLFGLPLGFLSLILYSVCCGDIMDAKEEEEEQEVDYDSDHEKRE